MPVKIDDLLRTATSHGASDLHLKVGAFPMMRIGGELHPIGDAPRMKPEDTLDMAFSMMTSRQKQRFKDVSEVDIGYGLSGVGRFRANIFQQRGTVSVVLRVIPDATKNTSELGLPPVIDRIAARTSRSNPGNRVNRFREVNNSGRHDRPDKCDSQRSYCDHRRPHRVLAS